MTNLKNNKFLSYGIDLGTTNSCVAQVNGSEIRIFQTKESINTTRSAVYINKNNRLLVGMRAYYALSNDEENVAVEFKRLMGTSNKKFFPSAKMSMSPEELSAEIIKSIRQDVERLTGNNLTAAVITVPAAFGTLQCEATYKAAELAGLDHVHLLQEPIAASIAYSAKARLKEKTWMVFDLGGGTFDVAIVSTHNNRLTVLNNEGNNFLGGKDIDRLIVEKIFLPKIEEEYNLFDSNDEEYHKLFKKLLLKAEEVKIELSNLDATVVFIEEVGEDIEGNEINLNIKIQRKEFEILLVDIIDETLVLAQKSLDNSNIANDSLDKIILVGGSTQIPIVRKKLQEHFKVETDCSFDPITVVAKGAAIYASEAITNVGKEELPEPDECYVELEYEPITSSMQVTVAGRLYNTTDVKKITIDSKDGFWTSGWMSFKDKNNHYFEIDIMLQKNKTNDFVIHGRDDRGNNISIQDPFFSIKHKEDHIFIAKPLVPHSLCIEYIDDSGNRKLEPIIHKNSNLPAHDIYNFKTTKELKPSKVDDFLAIKLWEGEYFDEPGANIWVANLYIYSDQISRPLHKGNEVTITVEIDESRRITIGAEFQYYNGVFTESAIYKPTPIDIEEQFDVIKEDIDEYYKRLEYLEEKIPYTEEDKRKWYNQLYETVENFSIEYYESIGLVKYDKDQALILIEKSKSIRTKIYSLEKDLSLEKQSSHLEKDAIDTIKRVGHMVNNYGSSEEKEELKKLKRELHETIEFRDHRGVKHVTRKANDIEKNILSTKYDFWQYLFYHIRDNNNKYIDQNEANKWIVFGESADSNLDMDSLKEAVIRLTWLIEKDLEQVIQESIIPPNLQK